MDETGGLLLVDDPNTQIDARYKKYPDGRLFIQGGFRPYANKLGLKVNDLVRSNLFPEGRRPSNNEGMVYRHSLGSTACCLVEICVPMRTSCLLDLLHLSDVSL